MRQLRVEVFDVVTGEKRKKSVRIKEEESSNKKMKDKL